MKTNICLNLCDKVKARHFYATKRFIDNFGALNDGGAFADVYKDIHPPELQLKVEHSGTHATFLNLDIKVKDGVFIYKLFISVMLFRFLLFAWLTSIVTSLNQYFVLMLLVNSS